MTATEIEEEDKCSKMAEIKKEEVEGINLMLNEAARDSDFQDHQIQTVASNSENHIEKARSSDKEVGIESKRAKKRTRITEEEESEEEDEDLDKDPLLLTEEIVMKYHSFVDYLLQRLKEEEKDEEHQMQMWAEILERGSRLVKTLSVRMKRVSSEMEWLKELEGFEKEYLLRKTHFPHIFARLKDINMQIVSSHNISLVSDTKNRGNVLSQCLDELESSKEELNEIMEGIKVLKQVEKDEDEQTQ